MSTGSSTVYIVNTETILPDIPHTGVCMTNPTNASAILLPLAPPDFFPKVPVLVRGGTVVDSVIQASRFAVPRYLFVLPHHTHWRARRHCEGLEVVGTLRDEGRPPPESV